MAGALKTFYNNFFLFNRIRYLFTPYMIQKKKGALLFDDSEFYRINLNCRGDAYFGYVNIEDRRTKARVFVSPMHSLPFSGSRVKLIFIDFETIHKRRNLDKIFAEFSRIIVPNGIVSFDNIRVNERILESLSKAGFKWVFKDFGNRRFSMS